MCSNTGILVILFILKILVFLIPIGIYVLKRLNFLDDIIKYLYYGEIVSLLLLISLSIFSVDCIKNSSISGIKLNYELFSDTNIITEDSLSIDFSNINPSKRYRNNKSYYVNYYNINHYPIKNIKVNCDNESFFQHYGNDISAIATGISTVKRQDINPYNLLDYATRDEKFSCGNKSNINALFNSLFSLYDVKYRDISSYDIASSLLDGNIVLGKTKVTNNNENLACGEKLVAIYFYDNKGNFNILNPSDKRNDYFCPSNTKGYGTIVIGSQNDKTFSLEKLQEYFSDFYVLEVK